MSYDMHDAEMDDMYDRISEELYPDHKDRAIEEFTRDRLRSFYKQSSFVMRPAVDMVQEGNRLNKAGHFAAAVVFYTSAVEILLKATVLKPVIVGLIHNDRLADVIVKHTLAGTGFERYSKLLSQLFKELAGIELDSISRGKDSSPLLNECTALQNLRNGVIHRGETRNADEAIYGKAIANAVFHLLVGPLLCALGLMVIERGEIVETTEISGSNG